MREFLHRKMAEVQTERKTEIGPTVRVLRPTYENRLWALVPHGEGRPLTLEPCSPADYDRRGNGQRVDGGPRAELHDRHR